MMHFHSKLRQSSVCLAIIISLALGLGLWVSQEFHKSPSTIELIPANVESRLAIGNPIELAVASLERQLRIPSKAQRRPTLAGPTPVCSLVLPDTCLEGSIAVPLKAALITHSIPNDRAPPLLVQS